MTHRDHFDYWQARAEQAEAVLRDFAEHGLSADLMPTTPSGDEAIPHLYRYLARLDQGVRERARAALGDVR